MKLLLFDIDMTLVDTGGAGRMAMVKAFHELFGADGELGDVSFAGRTDTLILRDVLAVHDIRWTREVEHDFQQRYFVHLQEEIVKPGSRAIKPGIAELLPLLRQRPDCALGLLTGNWREGARIKLQHFGLYDFFRVGAFSDDSAIRSDLPKIAAARFCQLWQQDISPQNVFVIGDTPLDVACAKPFGARTIAVATGSSSKSQLEAASPDYIFQDLSDVQAFLKMIV